MKDHATPDAHCPYCKALHNMASSMIAGNEGPRPGDVSVCIRCAAPLIFNDELGLRKPTVDEGYILAHDKAVQEIIIATAVAILAEDPTAKIWLAAEKEDE